MAREVERCVLVGDRLPEDERKAVMEVLGKGRVSEWNEVARGPTAIADDEPRPVPLEGMSAIVVISMPFLMPTFRNASRTSPCSILSTESTISVLA